MQQTMIFDTLQYAKRAKEVGFTEAQAEFQAEEIAKVISDQLATKKDIEKLTYRIDELAYKLTIRLGSMLVAAVSILAVLIKI